MKITANFARPPLPWTWAAASLWALTALALLLAAFAVRATREFAEEQPVMQARLERARAQLGQHANVVLPTHQDQENLRQKIRAWNQLAGVTGWGTAQLLGWLEKNTPPEVYFVSFQHEPRAGEALLVAQSTSKPALTAFLRTLEQQPAFSEVLLSKQSDRAGSEQLSQFEIRLRLRS